MTARSRPEPALFARLSPATSVVVHGRGVVHMIRGREAWALDDRETLALVAAVGRFHVAHRGGLPDAFTVNLGEDDEA